ncbi:MAG: R3H domain-containing nucleic acid-binding protein [bacterium]
MEDKKRNKGFYRKRFKNRIPSSTNVQKIIADVEEKLRDSITPEVVDGLNSFERRLIHRHFDHDQDIQTRTYRHDDKFSLFIYPVGNIERFAKEKAQEVLETGNPIDLPPMGSYERYIVHACLKEVDGVETTSHGEDEERCVQIISKKFGRSLKKIVKKIKLF